MKITNKVLKALQEHNLFGKTFTTIKEKVHKALSSTYSRNKIAEALEELSKNGDIVIEPGGIIRSAVQVHSGKFIKRTSGSGYVVATIEGSERQIYVPAQHSKLATHGSEVTFSIYAERDGEIAHIVDVKNATSSVLFGAVKEHEGKPVFIPDDPRFNGEYMDLRDGDYNVKAVGNRVRVNVDLFPDSRGRGLVKITDKNQIFGSIKSPFAAVSAIMDEYGIVKEFSDKVLEEMEDVPTEITSEMKKGLKDLTHLPLLTIDPATAKDRDDAICVVPRLDDAGNKIGFTLHVAIAAVNDIVKPGSAAFKEALKRGNSIYPAGDVVPMLHEKVSNGICSLTQGEVQTSRVTTIHYNLKGEVVDFDIVKALVKVEKTFSYEDISALHKSLPWAMEKFGDYKSTVDELYRFEAVVRKQAVREGLVTLKGYQPTIVLSEERDKVIDFKNDNLLDSHGIIERAMVATNIVTAETFYKLEMPGIHRKHETPKTSAVDKLLLKLAELGYDVPENPVVDNQFYQDLVTMVLGSENEKAALSLIIQSVPRAVYATDAEEGHFMLANKYMQITAGIRRSSDLVDAVNLDYILQMKNEVVKENNLDPDMSLHEFINDHANKFKKVAKPPFAIHELEAYCQQMNATERVADEISLKADEVCAALYMQQFVGQVKTGRISKVDRDYTTLTLWDKNDPEHSDIIDVLVPTRELSGGGRISEGYTGFKTDTGNYFQLGDLIPVKILLSDPLTRMILTTINYEKLLNEEGQMLQKKN